MISSHTAAAIAQTVFYVPAVPITLYVLIGNWAQGPRMAWYPLFAFALIRLVGGILVIVLGSQPTNYGLNVAAIVLLNIGLIPLIITTLFLVRFVFESSLQLKAWASIVLKALRINIFIAIGLLVAGGSLAGDSQNAVASRALGLAGYFNFLSILMALVWLLVYLYRNKNEFTIKGDYILYCKYNGHHHNNVEPALWVGCSLCAHGTVARVHSAGGVYLFGIPPQTYSMSGTFEDLQRGIIASSSTSVGGA
ncbi:hypothetical protein SCUP234_12398 [Seiridium cupressi]